MQIKMMMRMKVINFMNFYKVDGPVLLWHPICKCSSIMQIFIYTLCSAGKSRRNFHHKFFERENYRLYSYYSTSFSTISLLHIIIGAMPFRKGKGTPIILIIHEFNIKVNYNLPTCSLTEI